METKDTPHHVYLGGKLGFIYGSLSALAFVFGWFFIPETRQMELEDIDRKFPMSAEEVKVLDDGLDKDTIIVEETPK